MQKANRKSHLQAPLSPATQALLRSEGQFSNGPSPNRDASNSKTPPSGEIPIAASAGTQASAASSAAFIPDQAVQRVMSAGLNGGGIHNSYANDRPGYPPRTSSTSSMSNGKPTARDGPHTYIQPTAMPIRPAPPPGGPLPNPPGRDGIPRKQQIYPSHGQEGQMI